MNRGILLLVCAIVVSVCASGPKYAVSLIVKNEINTLPRLFGSLKPYVSYIMVCDTGSNDGTQDYARLWLSDNKMRGEVHEDPWTSFSWNRNQCLRRVQALAKNTAEGITHVILPDADFELVVKNATEFSKQGPPGDYNLIAYEGSQFYRQPLVISAKKRCGYIGVTHEYLACVDNNKAYQHLINDKSHTAKEREMIEAAAQTYEVTPSTWDAIRFMHHIDGSNRKNKFDRDAALLREDLKTDPGNARSWFYLAQSLENGGRPTEAFQAYFRRMMMGGSREEVWYSGFRLGVCLLANGTSIEESARFFVDAYSFNPVRAEPLYFLTRYYRLAGKWGACKMYGWYATSIGMPSKETLAYAFDVDLNVYEWGLADELSLCLYELGEKDKAAQILQTVLDASSGKAYPSQTTVSPDQRKRLLENLAWMKGLKKMAE